MVETKGKGRGREKKNGEDEEWKRERGEGEKRKKGEEETMRTMQLSAKLYINETKTHLMQNKERRNCK